MILTRRSRNQNSGNMLQWWMPALPPLTERFGKDIKGVIECFDRVVLFGTYKAIGWPGAMERKRPPNPILRGWLWLCEAPG